MTVLTVKPLTIGGVLPELMSHSVAYTLRE